MGLVSAQEIAAAILDHKAIMVDQDAFNVFPEVIRIVIEETRKRTVAQVLEYIQDIRLSDEYYDLTPGLILDKLQVKFEAEL